MDATLPSDLRLLAPERAVALVARLGFVLVHDDRLGDAGSPAGSHLVVALRDKPTLAHFDPERMTWWATSGAKGQEVEYHRSRSLPERSDVAWGSVRVIDRLEVQNAFVTFGGVVRALQPDPATTIVVLDSATPILRWSGHSQDVDPISPEVSAFFARLRVPIEFTKGAEARIARMTPVALYAAFVADLRARYLVARVLREMNPQTYDWLAHEAHRLEASNPADWDDGRRMLIDLELVPGPV